MIVALAIASCGDNDTPAVFVVDTKKCTLDWQKAIVREIDEESSSDNEMPEEWESLERACVPLPAMVEAAVFVYYNG